MRMRGLTARFPGSIHGDFDGAVVGGHLWRSGEHGDGQSEALSCSKTHFLWDLNFKQQFFFLFLFTTIHGFHVFFVLFFFSRLFSN